MSQNSTPNPSAPPMYNYSDFNMSPTQSTSHPLPSRPDGQPLSVTGNTSQSTTPVPPQAQPKYRGGFEVDEEEDGEDGVDQDDDDDADVYDPAISFIVEDIPASAGNGEQLDRTSQSPEQDNGFTPAPVQAVDTPADIPSALPDLASELRAGSSTPAQAVTATQIPSSYADVQVPATSVVPKTRLAHDVIGILQDRIKDDPRGDTAAWLQLIEELKSRNKIDEVRQTYNRYFEVFPVAVCLSNLLIRVNANLKKKG